MEAKAMNYIFLGLGIGVSIWLVRFSVAFWRATK